MYWAAVWRACLFLLPFFSESAAQKRHDFEFEQVNDEAGNLNGIIYALMQSENGLMWFGTEGGLVRYDGYAMEVFKNNPLDTNSVSNINIGCLVEDAKGNFWMGTWGGGVNRFDPKSKKFHSFSDCSPRKPECLSDNRVQSLFADKNGDVWVGTYKGGANVYRQNKGGFEVIDENTDHGISNNRVWSVVADHNGVHWLGTDKGLNFRDPKTGLTGTLFHDPKNPRSIPDSKVRYVYLDRGNILWVGTQNGLAYAPLKGVEPDAYNSLRFTNIPVGGDTGWALSNGIINVVYEDSYSGLWVGTGEGLNYIDRNNRHITQLRHNEGVNNSISHNDVRDILQSRDGLLWIGTRGGGVNKIDLKPKKFSILHSKTLFSDGLTNARVFSIADDGAGTLYVGTDGGGLNIVRYEGDNILDGNIKSYSSEMPAAGNPESLPDVKAHSIVLSQNGGLWVGTAAGLAYRDKQTGRYLRYDMQENVIHALLEDSSGRLWVGGDAGLFYADKENLKTEKMPFVKISGGGFPEKSILSLFQDSKGFVWAGTWGKGVCRINPKNLLVECYSSGGPSGLTNDEVLGVYEDARGKIWVLTRGGINCLNPEGVLKGVYAKFMESDGLSSNECYGMLEDGEGMMWISTKNGLSVLNPQTAKIRRYNKYDGLQDNAFIMSAYHKSPQGLMYFGGINGLNVFFPEKVRDNPHVPEVLISSFKKFGKEVHFEEGTENIRDIELDYTDNFFSFEFSALDYTRPQNNAYSYILEGFDTEWNNSGGRRYASYTNLKGGDYVFRVKAANNDGLWNEEGVSIKIKIHPPFWDMLWFQIAAVGSLLLAAFWSYSYRVKKVEKQKRILEKVVEDRTYEIVLKTTKLEEANRNIESSYTNIRLLSEIGRNITRVLDIPALVATVYEHAASMLPAEGFGIGVYDPVLEVLEFTGFIEKGEILPDHSESLHIDTLANYCFINQEDLMLNHIQEEAPLFIKGTLASSQGDMPKSLIYTPIFLEGEPLGVITVQSFRADSYTTSHKTILKTLATYTAIAINNSRSYKVLSEAKETIERKSANILDSIRYARTIQLGILPPEDYLTKCLADHFVIFLPKDIVSGDFYWCMEEGGMFFAAAIDCTGHGVPGAFMSMVGNTLLNEIILHEKKHSPADVLKQMHVEIRALLHQEEGANNDGMDVCLCAFDFAARQVKFAGAKRGLLHLTQNGLKEYKGGKKSIGGSQKEKERRYEETTCGFGPGETFYLTTDGYVDQNNPKRHKLGSTHFKAVLSGFYGKGMQEQKKILLDELSLFMEGDEQRDDITIFAIHTE